MSLDGTRMYVTSPEESEGGMDVTSSRTMIPQAVGDTRIPYVAAGSISDRGTELAVRGATDCAQFEHETGPINAFSIPMAESK
jgi:hypothetical protein